MAGSVVISPTNLSVVPGTSGTASVRIRNTGVVVDQFSVTVLGQPAVWTTAVPAVLSLFPGAEGTIELHFAPPRAAGVGEGPVPYAVRVDPSEDRDGSVVEEGEVTLLPYVDVQAKLTPRTSEAKRKARHEVLVDNRGNAAIEAEVDASDPDELLAFEIKPRTVTVPAGQTSHVPIRVAARKGFLRGTDKHRPFQVRVNVGPGQGPITLDGTLMQKPGMPGFVLPLIGAAVVIALLAVMLPALRKEPGSGKLSLTSEGSATTTTAAAEPAPAAEEAADPNAPATPEEQAAAAEAERAANGQDAGAGATGTGGGTSAAGTGGEGATATTAPPPPKSDNDLTEEEAPPVTAVPAPPPSTTTVPGAAPASTTTTAPSNIDMYYVIKQESDKQAHWHYVGDGTIGQTFKANAPFISEAWLNLYGKQVTFNIRKGGPGGAIVASAGPVAIVQYGWTKVTFPKTAVSVGGTYYLEGVVAGGVYAWYSNTNDYADGDGFFNGGAHGHDLNARVIGRTG